MIAAPESHIYVYGVARCSGATPLPAGEGVIPGAPVQLLPIEGLTAVVSIFPASSAVRDSAVSEDDWAKSRALAHHRVLTAFAPYTALAPSKFGTVLRSLDDLAGFVRLNASALESTLNKVAECQEWGLKLFGDNGAASVSVESNPALAAMQEELACASAGKAYFLRKKLQMAIEAEAQRLLVHCLTDIHRELGALARDSKQIGRLPPSKQNANKSIMLLNAAYLVERSNENQFHAALAAMRGSFSDLGLSDVLTGPWPAYNFVSLPVGMADHD
jgi:hypothetical protein